MVRDFLITLYKRTKHCVDEMHKRENCQDPLGLPLTPICITKNNGIYTVGGMYGDRSDNFSEKTSGNLRLETIIFS